MRDLESADYQRAERMLPHHRQHLVTGRVDRPRWLPSSETFWYRTTRPGGVEYRVADPVARTVASAFDSDRLATSVTEASGSPVDASTLTLSALEIEDGAVVVGLGGQRWRCSLDDYTCTPLDPVRVAGPGESLSPDGRWAVFVADHDLRARDRDGTEVRLTHNGAADDAYAVEPTMGGPAR